MIAKAGPGNGARFFLSARISPFPTLVPIPTGPCAVHRRPVLCHSVHSIPHRDRSRKDRGVSARIAELANGLLRVALPFASRGTLIALGFASALLLWESLAF